MKLVGLLLFLFQFALHSQTIYEIQSPVDDTSPKAFQKSLSGEKLKQLVRRDHYLGFYKASAWYKISYPEKKNSPPYLYMGNPQLGEIDIYLVRNGSIVWSKLSGIYRPYDPSEFFVYGFIYDFQEKGDYYLKVHNEDTHRINFTPFHKEELLRFVSLTSIIQGIYIGISTLVIVFGITQWIFTAEKIYLYLAFSTFSVSFANTFRSGLLFTSVFYDTPYWSKIAAPFVVLTPFSMILFFREFMQTKKLFPNIDKSLVIYLYIIPFTSFINIIGVQEYIKVMYTNNLVVSLFALSFGIYAIVLKTKQGVVFFIACLVRQLGTSTHVLTNLGVFTSTSILNQSSDIGAAVQMIIFTIAISRTNVRLRKEKEKIIQRQNTNLENMVFERTIELQEQKKNLEETLNYLKQTQNQLVYSEKMNELGKLVAGIAHELNNPLSAIKASSETLSAVSEHEIKTLEKTKEILSDLTMDELTKLIDIICKDYDIGTVSSYTERKEKKKNLKTILSENQFDYDENTIEKLLDVGIESPTQNDIDILGHKNKNVIDYIINQKNINLHLSIVKIAVDRASKIISALKNFSRVSRLEEKRIFDLVESIETVLTIYQYKMKNKVSLKKTFLYNANVLGWPEEIVQVWTNIILNALQAMNDKGNLILMTQKKEETTIEIRIRDNGPGIPIEIQKKVFDPFFTTKNPGEGSGLGLDLTKSIVEKHGGTIRLESEEGKTEFIINLPVIEYVEV
ncbi:sensor histidine kinase [Leptospira ilyithenensis]|uniref:histidine kinase n=1 Tax=Leptospira ilyithenensis TaxID=2484901 RepID=A0A4R9LLR0_9LEPT|nr:ATP-binding protein [Leptospira ilyithenensis]TGN06930.1 GHKL domain-containing protein [Leptospira ilyithenensis]